MSGMAQTHNCSARCCKCRIKFPVCQGDRHVPMFQRPWRMWCAECSQSQMEHYLNGAGSSAPCPRCWVTSVCEGTVLIDDGRTVHCRLCGHSWPALGLASAKRDTAAARVVAL